jgi:predicted DNA-binding transcriptional regulator YafY
LDRFDRIYLLHRQLAGRRVPLSEKDLEAALECSRATVQRTIQTMRDHLDAPIVYDRERNGYHYDGGGLGPNWELPGLWFSAGEMQALLTLERLLSGLTPGLLSDELRPFRERIEGLLQRQELGTGDLYNRLRILGMGVRELDPVLFRTVAQAVAARRDLQMAYRSRSRDEGTERRISPQRLVFYRDNWYLDAWCHLRKGARIFAVDRIARARITDEPAHEIDEAELDDRLASSYGIFHGVPRATAILRFGARMARWVSEERWHPQQNGQWLVDGRYQLEIPYADPTELVRDVLRFGPDVEVVKPEPLRTLVADQLAAALVQYRSTATERET